MKTVAEGWAERIQHMLTRPRMFCRNNQAYLGAMRTAFEAWSFMRTTDGYVDPRMVERAWRAVMQEGYATNSLKFSNQASDFDSLLRINTSSENAMEVTAAYMDQVWRRMQDPVSMLGDLVRE